MKPMLIHFKSQVILTLCILIGATTVAMSQTPEDKTLSPYFMVYGGEANTDMLPLKETSAKVNIAGVIADVTIRQVYKNTGRNTLEATYVFPMSTKAAVYDMQMTIGNRTIKAKIEEKEKARRDYEKAKAAGKRTSLLEQNRPNVFTMNVANIAAGDEIVVELKYTELLIPENGIYSFIYPTVVGPRYSNIKEKEAGADDKFVASPYHQSGEEAGYLFGIDIAINAGIPLQDVKCSSHKPRINFPDLHTAHIHIPSSRNAGNRDVIVNYSLRGKQIESGIMLYEGEKENFFLAMIQPPVKILQEEIPPREYVFIVDVSGSMHGFPLNISKTLLRNLIVNLKPTDRFNVVIFESAVEKLSSESLEANEENIEKAIRFIDEKRGYGGTNLLDALKQAYAIPRFSPDLSRSFVIVTDGFIRVENEAFGFIRNNSNKTNFFSFGIGSSVNRHLIEGMALMGHGEAMIITQENEAAEQAEQFRHYINAPVLTQIKVSYNGLEVYDVEPVAVPDLLAERPIIIYGKYKGKATGSITIQGKTGSKTFKRTFDLSSIKPNAGFTALRYLWARQRIKFLDSQSHVAYDKQEIKQEITALGLEYGLMTAYTSFIAIDEEYITDLTGKRVAVQQPLPLPEGVSDRAIGSFYSNDLDYDAFTGEYSTDDEEVFMITDHMPVFPLGDVVKYLAEKVRYPKEAQEKKIQGKVFVRFVVNTDGSISDVEVVRGVDPLLDAEAIRVVSSMPKWTPGSQRGKAIRVSFTVPINFFLNDQEP